MEASSVKELHCRSIKKHKGDIFERTLSNFQIVLFPSPGPGEGPTQQPTKQPPWPSTLPPYPGPTSGQPSVPGGGPTQQPTSQPSAGK